MKKIIILFFSCLFIFLHFANLVQYLINFPNWGDDFTFLAYFIDLPTLEFTEFWNRSTEFHGFIHRMVGARLITAIYHLFSDEFNFKTLTICVNVLIVSILYPIYQLVQKAKINLWHFIPISGLLFAWNGNLDNYALIGVLVHATSLSFLIWVSYWISQTKTRNWGIGLSLIYPFISTEGLAFIPVVLALLFYQKDRKAWIYSIAGLLVIYLYFINYDAPKSASANSGIEKLLFLVQGSIVFIGGAIKHQVFLSMIAGTFLIGNVGYTLLRYHQSKDPALLFAGLVFIQIIAMGTMITLGRGNVESGDLNALFAERFSFYGTVFICITYFVWIQPPHFQIPFSRLYLMAPAFGWIVLSAYAAYPKLQNLRNRLQADASNAYYFKLHTLYPFARQEMNLLTQKGIYQFPNELFSLKPIGNQIQITPTPEFEPEFREFAVDGSGTILVFQNQKPRLFLPINSLSHRVKIKKDVPFNERTSKFLLVPSN